MKRTRVLTEPEVVRDLLEKGWQLEYTLPVTSTIVILSREEGEEEDVVDDEIDLGELSEPVLTVGGVEWDSACNQ